MIIMTMMITMMNMITVMMITMMVMVITMIRMTMREMIWELNFLHFFLSFNRSMFYFDQTLLQECLSPVAEEVCTAIAKTPDVSDTPLQKLIR